MKQFGNIAVLGKFGTGRARHSVRAVVGNQRAWIGAGDGQGTRPDRRCAKVKLNCPMLIDGKSGVSRIQKSPARTFLAAMILAGLLLPAAGGINLMTNGPSCSGSSNWSLASAPVASGNPGSFQDLVFQPVNTNQIHVASGNLYSQSLNVTNGGTYSIVANSTNSGSSAPTIRPGNTPTNTSNPFLNSVSGGSNDLFYLANNSSLAIYPTNLGVGDPFTLPLQQAGNFNVQAGSVLTLNAAITGSSAKKITLTGGGTNVFGGTNSYAGDTTLTNGTTLILNGTIGNSSGNPITVTSNSVLNEGINGTITGTTPLTLLSGSIVLSGTNTYAGITKLADKLQVWGAPALSANSVLNSGGSTSDNSELNLGSASSGYGMSALSVGGIMRFTGPASGLATLTFSGAAAQGFTGGAPTKKISVGTNVAVVLNGQPFELLGAAATTNRNHTIQVDGAMTFNDAVVATGSSYTAGFTKTGTGVLTLNGSNTCNGDTTISAGRLALGAGGSIAHSTNLIIASNATFDVAAVSGFALLSSQVLSNSTSGGIINGSLNASAGSISLASYSNGTPCLTVSNGTLTLAAGTTFKVSIANGGYGLSAGSYKLIAKGGGGSVGGSAPSSAILGGDGLAAGAVGSLSLVSGELFLGVTGGSLPTLGVSQSGMVLTFTWTGPYKLQSQTNALNAGLRSNWFDYPGGTVSGVTATVNPTNPAVFFRLSQ